MSAPLESPRPSGHGPYRIMIVDDDRDICEALADRLQAWGYDVITCHDGASAVAMMTLESMRSPVHLVLLDLHLPGMDGMAVLRQLGGPDNTVPVIIMSATARAEAFWDAIGAGAVDWLPKPLDYEELCRKCHLALHDGDP
ncbi:MAG: response regulator [Nitrospiraceae bacterium]|nr:response regulator [Nitrospiraceae bacterium]